jgi:hypothetical protein
MPIKFHGFLFKLWYPIGNFFLKWKVPHFVKEFIHF